ncbi:MAG: AAA family ATPase [Deltaproteobacteria bacterium]|nr:AAA family ATPase [Deltaproteobacteria bacterium]
MDKILSVDALRWYLDEKTLDVDAVSSDEDNHHGRPGALGQERALIALELGLGISGRGFNIFVVGAPGTGRTSTVRTELVDRAASEPIPDDWVLLYNFDDRDQPHAIALPPKTGPEVKRSFETLVDQVLNQLEKAFDSDGYLQKKQEVDAMHETRTNAILGPVEEEAATAGFLLTRAGSAISLGVTDEDGVPLSEEAFEELSAEVKQNLEAEAEGLQSTLEEAVRKIRVVERETDETYEKLAKETADLEVSPLFAQAEKDLADVVGEETFPRLKKHMDEMHQDILSRLRRLAPEETSSDGEEDGDDGPVQSTAKRLRMEEEDTGSDEPALLRYRVNVLVTQGEAKGAPVISETHPTLANLIGRIEHKVRGSEAVADFTRIKAGALYKANGGYLLLQALDLLREASAWEGLKRALKNRQVELDDPGEPGRMVTVASLRPEPVPLALKVVLIGTPDLYYELSRGDPEFQTLFKVKVDFNLDMDRSPDRIQRYLRFLVGLAHEEELQPVHRSSVARVVEHAARVSHNREKLTTRFGWMADLLREASFWAKKSEASHIKRVHVDKALKARSEREGFLEQRMHEDIADRRVVIETSGSVTGQINGLTVLDVGRYAFGMPVRISCKVGAGKSGELLDIEREVELGGPLHTKGTFILRGLLTDRFGDLTPIKLAATLCMEQNYSEIDGDSASLAEACVLFSALAEAPIRQDIALTGSIDQRGRVQTVGGVNEKIEGFFRICSLLHDDKEQPMPVKRVILPTSNIRDLMLDDEVVEAVKAGTFEVGTVETLEDTLFELTGVPWQDGSETCLHARILKRLQKFAALVKE